MLPDVTPVEALHSFLDIFEQPTIFITFNTSIEQKIGPVYPVYAPNRPTLELEMFGVRDNFTDLQNIYLELKCRILRLTDDRLVYYRDNAVATDSPILKIITLHSLFFECSITANANKISSANGNYAQEEFIGTDFYTTRKRKKLG